MTHRNGFLLFGSVLIACPILCEFCAAERSAARLAFRFELR